jgi:peptidoglycan hydrolase CwlO-like protein
MGWYRLIKSSICFRNTFFLAQEDEISSLKEELSSASRAKEEMQEQVQRLQSHVGEVKSDCEAQEAAKVCVGTGCVTRNMKRFKMSATGHAFECR